MSDLYITTAPPAIAKAPRLLWPAALLLLLSAAPAFSQDLGELARQQRQRKQDKQEQTTRPAHVYDNDDLEKSRILIPEDQQRAQTAKQKMTPPTTPAPVQAESAASQPPGDTAPLGDIARHYRALAAARRQSAPGPEAPEAVQSVASSPMLLTPPAPALTTLSRALPATPAPVQAESAANQPPGDTVPLGDIARHYRALEAAHRQSASHTENPETPASWPLLTAPTLAHPSFLSASPLPETPAAAARAPHTAKMSSRKMIGPAAIAGPRLETGAEVAPGCIRVQPGDTPWSLAQKYLGHGRDWPLLLASNPQVSGPRRLQAGAWVRLPALAGKPGAPETAAGPPPEPAVKRAQIRAGDSLWRLSQRQFGTGGAWSCIAQANPQIRNMNLIFPGQTLAIPETCSSAGTPGQRHAVTSAS